MSALPDTWPDYALMAAALLLHGKSAVVELPYVVPEATGVRLLPGVGGQEAGASLAAVSAILDRCVPWCSCYLAPYVELDGQTVLGCAGGAGRYLAVSLSSGVLSSTATAHHEVWHASECVLRSDLVARVESAAAMGLPRDGAYHADPEERRARLYEAWACATDEGLPVSTWSASGVPVCPVVAVLHHVYSGGLAADVAVAEAARHALRRGLLSRLLGR